MKLTPPELERFARDGFLVLPELFSAAEVAALRADLAHLFAEDCPANIREKHSGEVRTAMAAHLRSATFARLVRHPRLLGPAMQLLGERLYAQQVKINVKTAFSGETWQWHYDFATHHREDGVPEPLALNLHILLDDVTEFNGPLYFIPGSHAHGAQPAHLDTATTSYPLWVLAPEVVRELIGAGTLVSATGPAGTALIFGDLLVHGSPPNMSPWNRAIFSLIVNPVSNALTRHQRPDHQHHRALDPLSPLPDNCLLAPA